ncbi:MAG: hypothetical protein II539_00800 [Muribaculaceae bacterium]|nr:hypothetical protein [Muribaculaceae bacterium]
MAIKLVIFHRFSTIFAMLFSHKAKKRYLYHHIILFLRYEYTRYYRFYCNYRSFGHIVVPVKPQNGGQATGIQQDFTG